jgi:predicted PurR-regulated permease PerM
VAQNRRLGLAIAALISAGAVVWMCSTIWVGLMLGAMMAFTGQPLFDWLSVRVGERRLLSALLVTILGGLSCLVGGMAAVYAALHEVLAVVTHVQERISFSRSSASMSAIASPSIEG